jgi:hypothetical protein
MSFLTRIAAALEKEDEIDRLTRRTVVTSRALVERIGILWRNDREPA